MDAGYSTRMTSSSTAITADFCSFPDVDLLKAGTWDASTGRAVFTRADLAAAVASAKILPSPPLKLGHESPLGDGAPALGHVENIRLADAGNTLRGDLVDVPAWLAEIMVTSYPQRSIEATFNFHTNSVTHRFVLTGLALLGASWPAVTDLESLKSLYQRKAA